MVEYTAEMQKLYIEFLVSDNDLFVRCNNILNEQYFSREFRSTVAFIREYADTYGNVPDLQIISANTSTALQDITSSLTSDNKSWFLDSFEQFSRHKALEIAILASTDKLENNEYGAVELLIKEAVAIGLPKSLGEEYWADPLGRLDRLKHNNTETSTGWKTMDSILYGGFKAAELNIFAGASGAGKSLFLQNLAFNWSILGHNVLYISLELSEDLCGMRLDSMVSGMSTKSLFQNSNDAAMKIKLKGQGAGNLNIVQMENGIDVNDIKAYIKEYQIQHNIELDAILVDYLDLMSPAKIKVSPDNVFQKDKFVSEELRNLAVEGKYLFATASQLNRTSVDETEFDHSHISGGLSKIQTADNVIGIFSSRAMKENGRVQVQFMKTRSSTGVGKKLDLKYNIDTMRIEDLEEEDVDAETVTTAGLYKKLSDDQPAPPVTPTRSVVTNTDRLRQILSRVE
jgi:archaellum biogenesis ATPase FlaH